MSQPTKEQAVAANEKKKLQEQKELNDVKELNRVKAQNLGAVLDARLAQILIMAAKPHTSSCT